jgi:hypothetical protein
MEQTPQDHDVLKHGRRELDAVKIQMWSVDLSQVQPTQVVRGPLAVIFVHGFGGTRRDVVMEQADDFAPQVRVRVESCDEIRFDVVAHSQLIYGGFGLVSCQVVVVGRGCEISGLEGIVMSAKQKYDKFTIL